MIEVAVYNQEGDRSGSLTVDEARLGGQVRHALLKQAIVAYEANRRQGTVATRSRGMVAGSTRKIYRQKGTGNARMGPVRTPQRRGGGVAFAKVPRDFSKTLSRKTRRLARDNALLAKLLAQEVLVLDQLKYEKPKTAPFARLLAKLGIDRGCLLALHEADPAVFRSARNVDRVSVCLGEQLNAYDILSHRKLLVTRAAFDALLGDGGAGGGAAAGEQGEGAEAVGRPAEAT